MTHRSPSYSPSPKRGRDRSPIYTPSPRRGRYRSSSYSPSARRGNYRSPSYSPLRKRGGLYRNPSYSPSPSRGRYRSQSYRASTRRGRYRSVSNSPSGKSRHYRRRGRSPSLSVSPRGPRKSSTSLLVRNLHRDCRPDDLRRSFREFGLIKDIYLPRNYYTGEPRGFGFVQYFDPGHAADAKYYMDRQIILGREIAVVFAEESRKTPYEMRYKQRGRSGHDYHHSSYERSYSRSRSPGRSISVSSRRQPYSRSVSPNDRRHRQSQYSSGSRSLSRSLSRNKCCSPEDYTCKRQKELSSSYSTSYSESSDMSAKRDTGSNPGLFRHRSTSIEIHVFGRLCNLEGKMVEGGFEKILEGVN